MLEALIFFTAETTSPDPLKTEGKPNPARQQLLLEQRALELLVVLVQLPWTKCGGPYDLHEVDAMVSSGQLTGPYIQYRESRQEQAQSYYMCQLAYKCQMTL